VSNYVDRVFLFVESQTDTTTNMNETMTTNAVTESSTTTTVGNQSAAVATQNVVFIGIVGASLLAVIARL